MGEEGPSDKFMALASKIKKNQWVAMNETLINLRELTGLRSVYDSLQESLALEIEKAFSPLKNELVDLMNTALEPFMPFVKDAVNEATTYLKRGIDYLTALLTGNLDTWMTQETVKLQKEMDTWGGDIALMRLALQKILYETEKWLKKATQSWMKFFKDLGWI